MKELFKALLMVAKNASANLGKKPKKLFLI